MAHYAVLWEIDGDSRPIGLAIDLGEYVYVEVPDYYGIPHRFNGEYRVMQPNGTHVVYRPGEAGYLEQILVDLSSLFAVGERDYAEINDTQSLISLLNDKVFRPREESRVGDYAVGRAGSGCPTYVREHAVAGFGPEEEAEAAAGATREVAESHLIAA